LWARLDQVGENDGSGQSMQPVNYYLKRSIIQNAKFAYPILGVLFISFAVRDFWEFFVPDGDGKWWDALTGIVLILASLAVVRSSLRVFRHGSADENVLSLQEGILDFTIWGHRSQWSWQALPAFQLQRHLPFWRRSIRFAVADPVDWKARVGLRPCMKISSGGLLVVIPDSFEEPLDEIVRKLNEFRQLRGGSDLKR
jgi:hypothetical protein